MRIIVDGIVYGRQTYGGINTYFNQVLPRIASRPGTTVDILLPPVCKGAPPDAPVRRLRRNILPTRTGLSWRLDDRIEAMVEHLNFGLTGLWAMTKMDSIFHSTYFTWLPTAIPHVGIALDLNHEVFPHLYSDDFGRWLRRRYPVYLRHARRIIAISQTTKDLLTRFYGIDPELVDVVHLATDPSTFYVDRNESAFDHLSKEFSIRQPYLLYVGVHSSAFKNLAVVRDALTRWPRHTPMTLVVAGPPWDERQREMIAGLPRHVHIRLVPNPREAALRTLYNFATAFVYPSFSEGFGIPLLEAMACGTPVLASDIAVFREVAGDAALYFDPGDPAAVVAGLERCLDRDIRGEYVGRGLRRVTRYSWDATAAGTYEVYQKALA